MDCRDCNEYKQGCTRGAACELEKCKYNKGVENAKIQ